MIWKLLPDRCSHWSLVCSLGSQGNHWRTSSALRGLRTALQASSFLMTAYDWTPGGSPKLMAYPSCFIPSIVATQAFRWSSDPQADSCLCSLHSRFFFCQDHLQMADFLTHVPAEIASLLLHGKQHPSSPSCLSIPPHPTLFFFMTLSLSII